MGNCPAPRKNRESFIKCMKNGWYEELVYHDMIEVLEDNDLILESGISGVPWKKREITCNDFYRIDESGDLRLPIKIAGTPFIGFVITTIKGNGDINIFVYIKYNGLDESLGRHNLFKHDSLFKKRFLDGLRRIMKRSTIYSIIKRHS